MSDLTDAGRSVIADLSARFGLSQDAVEHMARAVANGGGTMAQFNIPELGGSGQWMAGGMTMVGDMFNYGLKATVDTLCGALSSAMAHTQFFKAPQTLAGASWWPGELGHASSVGGQNQTRYAYFPQACRIAFDPGNGGAVILLDTLDHQIGGFSQQQSGPGDPFAGITFSSQYGQFTLSSLPRLGGGQPDAPPQDQYAAPSPSAAPEAARPEPVWQEPVWQEPVPQQPVRQDHGTGASAGDILSTIERLAALHAAGALTDDEFTRKKAELLSRL